ncbi:MAG: DUF2794 domain-containing protein [Alphaproteobacteria bacterium]|nr:DUF2794 domain-containing protein [Alphaproteobacteria bacterium]
MQRISSPKKLHKPLFFNRDELGQILATYSTRVASGEWRDYAIDHLPGSAAFSIFRHTHETPLYVVEKQQRYPTEQPKFTLRDRNKILFKGNSMKEIVSYFNRLPRLITG